MPDVPTPCSSLQEEVEGLQQDLEDLQQLLLDATTGEKPALVLRMHHLTAQLNAAQTAYSDCLANNPSPPALASNLSGAIEHIDVQITMPGWHGDRTYDPSPQVACMFSPYRDAFTVTTFSTPALVEDGFCKDVATVTMVGNAVGVLHGRDVTLPIQFHITHSNIFYAASDISLTLTTTDPGGREIDTNGLVAFVGSGTLKGGVLDGSPVTMSLSGVFTPAPFML